MSFIETSDVQWNAKNNNNIAIRSVQTLKRAISQSGIFEGDFWLRVSNGDKFSLRSASMKPLSYWLTRYNIYLMLDSSFYNNWAANYYQGSGFTLSEGELRIDSDSFELISNFSLTDPVLANLRIEIIDSMMPSDTTSLLLDFIDSGTTESGIRLKVKGSSGHTQNRLKDPKMEYGISADCRIFPSIVENRLRISNCMDAIKTIEVYDLSGQRMQHQMIHSSINKEIDMDVSNLSPGLFIVRLDFHNKHESMIKKFVKI